MLKSLFKDSVVYGVANAIQKLVPLIIIPIVIQYLGPIALKVYDVAFIYAYLFSWLIILGQDSAASVFYFDAQKTSFNKKQVIGYGLAIQVVSLLLAGLLFFLFSHTITNYLFSADTIIGAYWLLALLVIPGHIFLNYSLNILLWQKRKKEYIALCMCQTVLSVASAYTVVVLSGGSIQQLFYCLIGSTTLSGLIGFFLTRRQMFIGNFPVNKLLLKKLLVFGAPFALTSFLHQALPSVDRFFLLKYGYVQELPQYILAVKLGGLVGMAISAFALAFTPYSMTKLSEAGAEKELSYLFKIIAIGGFMLVPVLLLFKDVLLQIFADGSFELSGKLLPFFFFGWVFDLFSYFSMLGIYKAQNSLLIVVLFAAGIAILCTLNVLLIPRIGLYGAAIAFCISKACLFFTPVIFLRKHFKLSLHVSSFVLAATSAAACSYIIYRVPRYLYFLILIFVVCSAGYYLYRQRAFSYQFNPK